MAASGDSAAHIGVEFQDAFASWSQLRSFVAERAETPGFDTGRALAQLVMTDVAQRITAEPVGGWVLRGSLSLPGRAGDDPLPRVWQSPQARIDPRYVRARPAFDLDLCATVDGLDLAAAFDRVTGTTRAYRAGDGVGLGGLVHYTAVGLRQLDNGRVVAELTAQPIDPRRSRRHPIPVADPITFQVDLYPRSLAGFTGDPDASNRPTLAIQMPGFADYRPPLYPTVNQLADKLWTPVGPHTNPPWHRYKDLFDLYYLIHTCRFRLVDLRQALETNPNRAKAGLDRLPVPYRLYQDPAGPTWQDRYEQMRAQHPALAAYPPFAEAMAGISKFVRGIDAGPVDRIWLPAGQWVRHTRRTAPPRPLPPPPRGSHRGPSRRR